MHPGVKVPSLLAGEIALCERIGLLEDAGCLGVLSVLSGDRRPG